LPILQKLVGVYKLWHNYFIRLDKSHKYTIGVDIDSLFREVIKRIISGGYKASEQKIYYLNQASDIFDILKYMLQIAWEMKILDNNKYLALSQPLNEIGKMLGGWQRQTKTR
jgi:hypothetical protein